MHRREEITLSYAGVVEMEARSENEMIPIEAELSRKKYCSLYIYIKHTVNVPLDVSFA